MEEVKWDRTKVTSVDWASYPILRFPERREVDIELIDRPGEPPWGVGEPGRPWSRRRSATRCSMPRARVRTVPFTPERVKEALKEADAKRA